MRRTTAAVKADWDADSDYARIVRDEVQKNGTATSRTNQVLMIDGSDYHLPLAVDDHALTAQQERSEIIRLKTRKRLE